MAKSGGGGALEGVLEFEDGEVQLDAGFWRNRLRCALTQSTASALLTGMRARLKN